MNDATDNIRQLGGAGAPASSSTAGGLLRQARQAQGLHIAALAAAIKVTPRKLESLEADRYDELPDPAFTRALAQAMCRTLRVDAAAVLALLPQPARDGLRLEQVAEGLNTPFRERPGRLAPNEWARLSSLALWGTLLLLLAAGAVYLLPSGLWPLPSASAPAQPLSAETAGVTMPMVSGPGSEAAPEPMPLTPVAPPPADDEPVAAAAVPSDAAASANIAATLANAAMPVQFHTTGGTSWIDVTDARGQSLLSRVIRQGEVVGVDGALPLKVKIGNASVTRLTYRGQPMELTAYTKGNVARLELK